jgi:hypothetical protein
MFFVLLVTTMCTACFTGIPKGKSKPVNHIAWTSLLQKYVNKEGLVNYKGFIADSISLNNYLNFLSSNAPANSWTKMEQFAYWINAYNAFTVKTIINHYPVKSIKDISPNGAIPFVNTVWDKKFFSIGGVKMTLNTIEHKIIRKKFDDARLHFAVNCASFSCPKLLNVAYEAATLDAQLQQQAIDFLSDTTKNKVNPSNPLLSHIFKWFNGDFVKKGRTKVEFLNQFSPIKINADANLDYITYDWNLNEQK